jgi:hypothetical protein
MNGMPRRRAMDERDEPDSKQPGVLEHVIIGVLVIVVVFVALHFFEPMFVHPVYGGQPL